MESIILIIIALVGIGAGFGIDRFLLGKSIKAKIKDAEEKQLHLIKEAELRAENIKKDKILEAKEKYIKLKTDFEEEASRKKSQIISNENTTFS